MLRLTFLAALLVIVLAGCDSSAAPSDVIVHYLEARIASDVDKLRSLSCSAWESQVVLEADSFRGRNAELQGVSCQENGADSDYTIITCEGKIVTSYQGETSEFPAGNYRVIQEDGEWKMCGEAE